MIEDKKEYLPVTTVANNYSIQEITSIFSEIDEKILSLHSCSSEDFMTLNAYFKKYYSDAKIISDNALDLFNIITNDQKRKEFIENLKKFRSQLQSLLDDYELFVNTTINSFEEMIQEMDKMFVTANNLKQDIMTLKLLVTNLKLDIIISTSPNGKIVSKTNDFSELIVQTKSFFIEFYSNSNSFKEKIKELVNQLIQQKNRSVKQINEIIAEINLSTNLLDDKYNEAIQQIPILTEITKNTSGSIDKIITNLQYQDIIQQKITHIQQTHKDILKKIDDIKSSENEAISTKKHFEWLDQIRDIACLQAAQLIHANKQYQKAIEIISGKFLEVGDEMTKISDLCNQLIGNSADSNSSYFETIREKLEAAEYFSEIFEKSINFVKEKTIYHQRQLNEVIDNYDELSDFIFTIEKSITRSLDNQTSLEIGEYASTTNQIRSTLAEIKSINNLYHSQFEKIKKISFHGNKSGNIPSKVDLINIQLKQFVNNCSDLIKDMFDNNENIFKIIAENQILSNIISADIKISLKQIKYYDLFDKVIEEIILKLNEINGKFEIIDGNEHLNKLEYLKSRYTMESEHKIHETLISDKKIDKFDFNSTGAEEDDDNLELF